MKCESQEVIRTERPLSLQFGPPLPGESACLPGSDRQLLAPGLPPQLHAQLTAAMATAPPHKKHRQEWAPEAPSGHFNWGLLQSRPTMPAAGQALHFGRPDPHGQIKNESRSKMARNTKDGKWTEAEWAHLKRLVETYGSGQWERKAAMLGTGRTHCEAPNRLPLISAPDLTDFV